MTLKIYEKLVYYYKNSRFYQVLQCIGRRFEKYAANSSILRFFDREWNIGSAWKRSLIFSICISPLRLFKYASNKLSYRTNSTLEGSKALKGTRAVLESLFYMSSRVYGLLFLTFAVTQGLLDLVSNNGELLLDMKGIIRVALFLVGTMLILINRPLKSLSDGSIVCGMAYDFFTVRGLKDGTDDDV